MFCERLGTKRRTRVFPGGRIRATLGPAIAGCSPSGRHGRSDRAGLGKHSCWRRHDRRYARPACVTSAASPRGLSSRYPEATHCDLRCSRLRSCIDRQRFSSVRLCSDVRADWGDTGRGLMVDAGGPPRRAVDLPGTAAPMCEHRFCLKRRARGVRSVQRYEVLRVDVLNLLDPAGILLATLGRPEPVRGHPHSHDLKRDRRADDLAADA